MIMRRLILSVLALASLSMFADNYKLANIVCFVKFANEADKEWEHDFDYYDRMFNLKIVIF